MYITICLPTYLSMLTYITYVIMCACIKCHVDVHDNMSADIFEYAHVYNVCYYVYVHKMSRSCT